jgi:hypothetical protein
LTRCKAVFMYPETDSEVLLMITRSRDWYPLPYIAIWNGSISAWQLLNIGTMLYERSSTIDLPWTIHTPIKSSRAFREGLRDRRRKMTQIPGDDALELRQWGSAETAPRW